MYSQRVSTCPLSSGWERSTLLMHDILFMHFLSNYVISRNLKSILPSEIYWCFFLFKKICKEKTCGLMTTTQGMLIQLLTLYLFVWVSYVCLCMPNYCMNYIWVINKISFASFQSRMWLFMLKCFIPYIWFFNVGEYLQKQILCELLFFFWKSFTIYSWLALNS